MNMLSCLVGTHVVHVPPKLVVILKEEELRGRRGWESFRELFDLRGSKITTLEVLIREDIRKFFVSSGGDRTKYQAPSRTSFVWICGSLCFKGDNLMLTEFTQSRFQSCTTNSFDTQPTSILTGHSEDPQQPPFSSCIPCFFWLQIPSAKLVLCHVARLHGNHAVRLYDDVKKELLRLGVLSTALIPLWRSSSSLWKRNEPAQPHSARVVLDLAYGMVHGILSKSNPRLAACFSKSNAYNNMFFPSSILEPQTLLHEDDSIATNEMATTGGASAKLGPRYASNYTTFPYPWKRLLGTHIGWPACQLYSFSRCSSCVQLASCKAARAIIETLPSFESVIEFCAHMNHTNPTPGSERLAVELNELRELEQDRYFLPFFMMMQLQHLCFRARMNLVMLVLTPLAMASSRLRSQASSNGHFLPYFW
ncbi:hypothetical protein VNO77_03702 [Canavalia gladiata]|uniref:Uncharacterized protein n=1 Tax=Canavalia gladiata TaxID=3824 RepID=A0AAN9MX80_CANGL